MNVSIRANTIQQVINADTINIEQIKQLGEKERTDRLAELLRVVEQQSDALIKKPDAVTAESVNRLAHETKIAMRSIIQGEGSRETKKMQIDEMLKKIKECLGSTSDILLNAVKIAQILGI